MVKEIDARIQHKHDSDAAWTASNPVLLENELVFVDIDGEIRAKIGDGVSTYTQLDFTDEPLRQVVDTKANIYFSATKPTTLTAGDLWAKIV